MGWETDHHPPAGFVKAQQFTYTPTFCEIGASHFLNQGVAVEDLAAGTGKASITFLAIKSSKDRFS
jgi:hypothetical protein